MLKNKEPYKDMKFFYKKYYVNFCSAALWSNNLYKQGVPYQQYQN